MLRVGSATAVTAPQNLVASQNGIHHRDCNSFQDGSLGTHTLDYGKMVGERVFKYLPKYWVRFQEV